MHHLISKQKISMENCVTVASSCYSTVVVDKSEWAAGTCYPTCLDVARVAVSS